MLLGSAVELAAARAEDSVALVRGRRTVTYGELDAYSGALAFALERRGVEPGDCVATLLGGPEALVAFWGIAKAAAVGLALGEADLEELAEVLREVDARALIVDAGLYPTFHHAVARAPGLRAVIVRGRGADVEAAGSAAYVSYDTALAEEEPETEARALRRIDLDDVWLERTPDGERCPLSHRALLSRGASIALAVDLAPDDAVSGTPLSEIAVACALAGASFVVDDGAARPDSASGGRTLFIAGDRDDAEPWEGATPVLLHRSTRCGPIAVVATGNEPARVVPNVDVRIVDDLGAPVAPKVVGEIAVRSSNVAGSAEGVYFHTGESGMLDAGGALYVL
jgi:acyl-CoA synthetase (AMP-forming)/AMP-acid ligase II